MTTCFTCGDRVGIYGKPDGKSNPFGTVSCLGKCQGRNASRRRKHLICEACWKAFCALGIIKDSGGPLHQGSVVYTASECPTGERLAAGRLMGT